MKILVLSNVPPGTVGGAEVQALHLSRRWSTAGHEVLVAGYGNIPLSEGNLAIVKLKSFGSFRALRAASLLLSTLWLIWREKRKIDVIYCRFLKEQTFIASLAKIVFRLKQPVVACPACASTGGEAEYIAGSPLRPIWLSLLRNGVTVINAMSEQISHEVNHLGLETVTQSRIPNGVVIPRNLSEPGKDANPRRMVFVGRLEEQKGLAFLLAALTELDRQGVEFRMTIVGGGPLREELEAYVSGQGLGDKVRFTGRIEPEDIGQVLIRSDLFVLPSLFEGFPGALLEAVAHGLPAIVTKVSGSEEIVDSSMGWTVKPGDSALLADAIRDAISVGDLELQAMSKAAHEKAVNAFDMDVVAERYLKLFKELV